MRNSPKSLARRTSLEARPWTGAKRPYDLLKELTIGVIVVGVVIVGFAAVAGSPDEPTITLQNWAQANPNDFVATAAAELAGTSKTASYGPPYSSTEGATQTLGPLDLQTMSGVRLRINTAKDFVITPLTTLSTAPDSVATWQAASSDQQTAWATSYSDALGKAQDGNPTAVATGDYGPVPDLTQGLLADAKGGALDGAIQSEGGLYNTNPTPTILFLGDSAYFPALATAQHLTGDQWGMMNETGSYPGQSWLWLFSFWYQIPVIGSLPNADLVVVFIMLFLTLALALVPFIPGLRSIPRWIPLHRLIWRDYYRKR